VVSAHGHSPAHSTSSSTRSSSSSRWTTRSTVAVVADQYDSPPPRLEYRTARSRDVYAYLAPNGDVELYDYDRGAAEELLRRPPISVHPR